MKLSAEYIWVDGVSPTKTLRTKTQILKLKPRGHNADPADNPSSFGELSKSLDQDEMAFLVTQDKGWRGFTLDDLQALAIPEWGFDGSSTEQADTKPSDRPLKPVLAMVNPLRTRSILVLCEVYNADGTTPHESNTRRRAVELAEKYSSHEPWFGIEQEFTLFEGGILANVPYGWPDRGPPLAQGKYYCGVGLDEVPGHKISVEHEELCRNAGLQIRGTNGEVMPGQWEFQTDTCSPLVAADHLLMMRFLLYRVAAKHNATARLDPKPVSGDWNGAGAHTNFSVKAMRGEVSENESTTAVSVNGFGACQRACEALKARFEREGFPGCYGDGYQRRLTGQHETCSFEQFKYGVADRGASIRIPLHVEKAGRGYIEDRRPGANIDPYEVVSYLMETICEHI